MPESGMQELEILRGARGDERKDARAQGVQGLTAKKHKDG